jgi:CrcB protein
MGGSLFFYPAFRGGIRMSYLLVGIAGIIGTWLRYVLGLFVQQSVPHTSFPVGTLTVNLLGCFALGWISQWVMGKSRISPNIRTSISTGLIGSFTTFSTFSAETVQLFRQGLWGSGIAYVGTSMIGGLCLVWLGTVVACRRREEAQNG